jgi:hypothetical protein
MERHWPAEQMSLQNATAAGGQSEGLTFGFHTFRDNPEIERSSELDDRPDHFLSLAIGVDVSGERAIDLDDVQR